MPCSSADAATFRGYVSPPSTDSKQETGKKQAETRADTILRNVGGLLPNHTKLQARRLCLRSRRRQNLNSVKLTSPFRGVHPVCHQMIMMIWLHNSGAVKDGHATVADCFTRGRISNFCPFIHWWTWLRMEYSSRLLWTRCEISVLHMACGGFHKQLSNYQLLKKKSCSIPGQVIQDLRWMKWHWGLLLVLLYSLPILTQPAAPHSISYPTIQTV
jgi:hypothetical protein